METTIPICLKITVVDLTNSKIKEKKCWNSRKNKPQLK